MSFGEGAGEAGDAVHCVSRSTGKGKMMVEFFSALIEFRVCRYRSCCRKGYILHIR